MLKNEKMIPDDQNDPNPWQTYRTRFTIRARTLSSPLSFIDGLGREQNGKRGDYLVESNGMVTITARHVFEDVYVPLDPGANSDPTRQPITESRQPTADGPPRKSPISTKKNPFMAPRRRRFL